MTGMTVRTLGVDEEFLLVDVVTGRPAPGPEPVVTATPALGVLDDLRGALAALRRDAGRAAERRGAALVASGSSPVPARGRHAPSADRRPATPAFGAKVLEQPTCGCHVHVGVAREEGVAVIDRVRPWVSVLLALSANSPFWRAHPLRELPHPGPGPARVRPPAVRLVPVPVPGRRDRPWVSGSRTPPSTWMAPFSWPPSPGGLVDTAARESRQGWPAAAYGPELVRLATWRASRSGLSGVLVDVATRRPAPARVLVGRLIRHVRHSLEEAGDLTTVEDLAAALLAGGTGAARQRDAFRRSGRLEDVVRMLASRTVPDQVPALTG